MLMLHLKQHVRGKTCNTSYTSGAGNSGYKILYFKCLFDMLIPNSSITGVQAIIQEKGSCLTTWDLARANATDMSMKLPFFHDYIKTTSIS
jgi:hypothetical protein